MTVSSSQVGKEVRESKGGGLFCVFLDIVLVNESLFFPVLSTKHFK